MQTNKKGRGPGNKAVVSAQLSSVPRVLPMPKSKHGEEPGYKDMNFFGSLNTLERTRCLFLVKDSWLPITRLSPHANESDGKRRKAGRGLGMRLALSHDVFLSSSLQWHKASNHQWTNRQQQTIRILWYNNVYRNVENKIENTIYSWWCIHMRAWGWG